MLAASTTRKSEKLVRVGRLSGVDGDGGGATIGARCGAAMDVDALPIAATTGTQCGAAGNRGAEKLTEDRDTEADEDQEVERSEESDAPTEIMDRDHEVPLKRRGGTVRTSRNSVPHVQSKVLSRHEQGLEKNLVKSTKVSCQELTTQLSRTETLAHDKPKRYRFVHSDGKVELFTDTTSGGTKLKSMVKSNKLGRGQASDSEEFLTPSETEPDDSEFMSQKPVSLRQVRGLKQSGCLQIRQN